MLSSDFFAHRCLKLVLRLYRVLLQFRLLLLKAVTVLLVQTAVRHIIYQAAHLMIPSRWQLRVLKLPFVSKLMMICSGGDLRWAYQIGLASRYSDAVRIHLRGGHSSSPICSLDNAILIWDLVTLALGVVRGNYGMSEGTDGCGWACHFKVFSIDGGTASELGRNRTSMQVILIVVLRTDRSHSGIH